jgi:hypothetical protein
MFDKIKIKYNDYLEQFKLEQDKKCDYDTEPLTYEEFEEEWYEWHDRRD